MLQSMSDWLHRLPLAWMAAVVLLRRLRWKFLQRASCIRAADLCLRSPFHR
jgi:hypothetical protein